MVEQTKEKYNIPNPHKASFKAIFAGSLRGLKMALEWEVTIHRKMDKLPPS